MIAYQSKIYEKGVGCLFVGVRKHMLRETRAENNISDSRWWFRTLTHCGAHGGRWEDCLLHSQNEMGFPTCVGCGERMLMMS